MSAEPTPLPPELALTDPDLEDAVVRLGAALVEVANESAVEPDDLGAEAALTPWNGLLPKALEGWRIDGPGTAEWAMRHVAACDAELSDLEDQRDDWSSRISWWFTQAAGPLRARRGFFEAHLERYALEVRDADPTRKTVLVPSGKVTTTGRGATVRIVDADAALEWARENCPEVIQTTDRVLVTDLRDWVHPVEVIDLARLTFSDGEVVIWTREGRPVTAETEPFEARTVTSEACPGVADGWPPAGPTVLVGRVEVLAAHLEVRTIDGDPVPANVATVQEPTVSVSVKANGS